MLEIPSNFDFSPNFGSDLICVGRYFNKSTYQCIFIIKDKQNYFKFENWYISHNDDCWFWSTYNTGNQSGIYADLSIVLSEIHSIFYWTQNTTFQENKF
jgi:hypothetical protein